MSAKLAAEGRQAKLKSRRCCFCGRCVAALEALHFGGPEDALKILRGGDSAN